MATLLAASAVASVLGATLACAAAPPPPPAAAPANACPVPGAPQPAASQPTPSTPPLTLQAAPLGPPTAGAAEAMPSTPAHAPSSAPTPAVAAAPPVAPAPLHVVLADELPFHATHLSESSATARTHARHSKKKHGRHGRPYHPAPGIVVDVSDAQGSLGSADLQRAARNVGYWPFRRCYEEGLRRNQQLSGHVSLEFTMSPGGAVAQTTPGDGSTLRDESVLLCVAREAARLPMAMPAPDTTSARLDVTLSTGDEPVPVQRPVVHAEALREALRSSWPAVQQCYATGVAGRPGEGGRLELKFRVKPSGEIVEVAEGDTRFADVDVTRCVLGVYRAARLPALGHGSRETTFVYALHFESRAG
ncbi:MAG TPA: AgmX/PglI C-terminal domain-containing protein [Polyangiaceae bacterium]|nr:AgmX/PglI C-terminal domain-containing protein [Polyangiaceae bacterium]